MNQLRKPLNITLGVIVLLGAIIVSSSGFYIDWLWFKSVGFTEVWSTILLTKVTLFVVVGLVTSLFISANIYIAYKKRPLYVPLSVEADNLERYRAQLEPIRKWVFLAIAGVLIYFGGTSGSVFWSTWLQFRNATSFGVTDPQFGLDISFFAFKLPMYQALIGWGGNRRSLSLRWNTSASTVRAHDRCCTSSDFRSSRNVRSPQSDCLLV